MALVLDESFATSIPAGFATARSQSGALSVTYNSAQAAVDLSSATATSNIWDITSQPLRTSGEFEVDLELVADLSGANNFRHAGLWAVTGQAAVSNGFRMAHLLSVWEMIVWTGGTSWAGNLTTYSQPHGPERAFNTVGDRRILNCRWAVGPSDRLSIELRVDGALFTYSTYALHAALRPGIFVYQCTVRVHSVKVWDEPQAPLTLLGASGRGFDLGQLKLTPPEGNTPGGPANRYLGQVLGLRNIYHNGNGRIAGTVAVKSTPNIPVTRRVRLFDETTGLLIREVWSAPDGAYEFRDIDATRRYTVVSYDFQLDYRAVVADNLLPDLMT